MVVQTKTPIGWREVEKWEPEDPRVVYSAKSTDLVVAVPAQASRWRLKIIYGTENRGPALLLTRAELGITKRSLSGLGSVGVFTGQRAVAVEMAQRCPTTASSGWEHRNLKIRRYCIFARC
jgi:hypothetical protein